jgi:tight adherence protein B
LRTGVRIIVGVTVGFVGVLAALDSSYLDPYDTLAGQVVLVAVVGIFAAAFAWLRSLNAVSTPERLLTRHVSPGTAGAVR